MARYLAMMIGRGELAGQRILRRESIAGIEEEQHPNRGQGTATSQALYWHLRFDRSVLAHGGGDYGISTFAFYQPTWQTGAVILMNSRGPSTEEMMITCLQSMTEAMRAFRASSDTDGEL